MNRLQTIARRLRIMSWAFKGYIYTRLPKGYKIYEGLGPDKRSWALVDNLDEIVFRTNKFDKARDEYELKYD